jgi:hypothetical protein
VLLEKTWESLQESSTPKISIAGTVADLRRLGYNDQPIRLLQNVLVEIEETGEKIVQQIICLDVDLIDPNGNRVEIGDYISNIVYITRNTNDKASGGGGGGGGGKGSMTNLEDEDAKTWTQFVRTQEKIGMVVGTYSGTDKVLGGQIVLAINEDGGSTALIQADTIDIQGVVDELDAYKVTVAELSVEASGGLGGIYCSTDIECDGDISCAGTVGCNEIETNSILVGTNPTPATWQATQIRHVTRYSLEHYFKYDDGAGEHKTNGYLITSIEDLTIHYLGKAATV